MTLESPLVGIYQIPDCCRSYVSEPDSGFHLVDWRAFTCPICKSSWRTAEMPDLFYGVSSAARARLHALIDRLAAAAHEAIDAPKNAGKGDSWPELDQYRLRFEMWREIGEAREEQVKGDVAGMVREYGDAIAFAAMSVDNEREEQA